MKINFEELINTLRFQQKVLLHQKANISKDQFDACWSAIGNLIAFNRDMMDLYDVYSGEIEIK